MSDVVKGYASKFEMVSPAPVVTVWASDNDHQQRVPVLLIPDDGARVVVGREVVELALEFYRQGDHAYAYKMLSAAILGTNGGGE